MHRILLQLPLPATVIERARQRGLPNAARALAVADAIITVDQTSLVYRQEQGLGGPEFGFDTGTLRLTLGRYVDL